MKSIWYKAPSLNADDSIPAGNGRIGALLPGGINKETIYLNEESLWSKPFSDRNNRAARDALKRARTLLGQGRGEDALELISESFSAAPAECAYYRGAAALTIEYYDADHKPLAGGSGDELLPPLSTYKREADGESGICSETITVETRSPSTADFAQDSSGINVTYRRECFASVDSDVLVFHIASSVPKSIYFKLRIEDDTFYRKFTLAGDTLAAEDITGVPFVLMVTAVTSGGSVLVRGDKLRVEGADDVTLYIDIESAYRVRRFRHKCGVNFRSGRVYAAKCADLALRKICFAMGTSYGSLRENYIKDFISANGGCVLDTDESALSLKSADELKSSPRAKALLDWYCSRYKLILSSAGKATLPCVAGGIWERASGGKRFNLSGRSVYNEGANLMDLDAAALPFFTVVRRLRTKGAVTAEAMYGCQGFACHSATDIWGDAAPCGSAERGSCGATLAEIAPTGAACLLRAALDYYEYSLDYGFLKRNFPLFKDAALFFMDWQTLTGDENCGPDVYSVFFNTVTAMRYLGTDTSDSFYTACVAMVKRLSAQEAPSSPAASSAEDAAGREEGADFGARFLRFTSRIIASEMKNGRVKITLLEDTPEEIPDGSLSSVRLKGNIFADISWTGGSFKSARLYTTIGSEFVKDIIICYRGKEYASQLSEGTLDVRNVLPGTV